MRDFYSEYITTDTGARVEVSTFASQGRSFTALGSVVDHEKGIVTGYPKGDVLNSWDNKPIGTCRIVSRFRMARWSFAGGWYMYCYRAVVDGQPYYGRGLGDGMILRLRKGVRR
jgi:hypothetical protein